MTLPSYSGDTGVILVGAMPPWHHSVPGPRIGERKILSSSFAAAWLDCQKRQAPNIGKYIAYPNNLRAVGPTNTLLRCGKVYGDIFIDTIWICREYTKMPQYMRPFQAWGGWEEAHVPDTVPGIHYRTGFRPRPLWLLIIQANKC